MRLHEIYRFRHADSLMLPKVRQHRSLYLPRLNIGRSGKIGICLIAYLSLP